MIEIRELRKSFGKLEVLKGINVTIQDGDCVAIIGESGAGKSVLLRSIAMLERPDSGQIFFDGTDLTAPSTNMDQVREKMGMVYQGFYLFSHLNVLDNITLAPRKKRHLSRAQAEEEAMKALADVGLAAKAHAMPDTLSGGQKQRVAIARCLAMNPSVILFDEPTSALDPGMTGEVLAIIRSLRKRGLTMVIVTHEMEFARSIASSVIFMADGVIREMGTPKQIFDDPQNEATRAFIRKKKNFLFETDAKDFDFAAFLSKLMAFGERYNLPKRTANRLELMMEEVMASLCASDTDGKGRHINAQVLYSESNGQIELSLAYTGGAFDLLTQEPDELRQTLFKSLLQEGKTSYADGVNKLAALLRT